MSPRAATNKWPPDHPGFEDGCPGPEIVAMLVVEVEEMALNGRDGALAFRGTWGRTAG